MEAAPLQRELTTFQVTAFKESVPFKRGLVSLKGFIRCSQAHSGSSLLVNSNQLIWDINYIRKKSLHLCNLSNMVKGYPITCARLY